MKVNRRSSSDIISTLPSNITGNILKGLPLRDAVRTSILSRKWRHHWLTLPELIFDYQFFLKRWNNETLKAVIYQVLLFHQGPLIKFELWYPPFESCTDINNWIFILLTKSIQEFFLCLSGGPARAHEIPSHLFSFVQLRKLFLSNCVFEPPIKFKGFSRLVDLSFFEVSISSELLELFISNCPVLERVKLCGCSDFDSLKINAPNLKYLECDGTFESVSLENTPLLAEISVNMPCWAWTTNKVRPEEEIKSERVQFFHSLPAIEVMHLDRSFLEAYAADNVPERLPITLNRFKALSLSDICFNDLVHVSWALCLLKSSPNLQKLQISVLVPDPMDDPVDNPVDDPVMMEFLQAEDFSEISLNMLQKVKFRHFSGAEPEMHFVKILLAHSAVLEKMVILYKREMRSKKGFAMVKKLIRFHKASPKVELIVDETASYCNVDPA